MKILKLSMDSNGFRSKTLSPKVLIFKILFDSRSGEMDDLTNFDGDIYRPAIGSSDESLSNFKVVLD